MSYNLSGEEHATLAGLALSRRSTKDIVAQYNDEKSKISVVIEEEYLEEEILETQKEDKTDDNGDDSNPPGQMKLF
jgi:hypothetical protein